MTVPSITFQISANSVAWYGAIVSTGALVVSAYNVWKDRARLHISYQKGMRVINAIPPFEEDKEYFVVTVRNRGQRPVALGNVGVRLFRGGALLLSSSVFDQSTRVLTEESPSADIHAEQDLLERDTSRFTNAHYIEVYDRAGRQYRKYFSKFPTFRRLLYLITNHGK